jgi:hypothetical protein
MPSIMLCDGQSIEIDGELMPGVDWEVKLVALSRRPWSYTTDE